jgi:hypothetical protein
VLIGLAVGGLRAGERETHGRDRDLVFWVKFDGVELAHELNLRMWVLTFLKNPMNLTNIRTLVPTFLTKPTNIYQFLVVYGF